MAERKRRRRAAPAALALIMFAMLPGCAAFFPRETGVDRRLATLPARDLPLQRPVTIRWNDHLVPWIEAETDADLGIALGVVHGHLRGGQIALLRQISRGRLAEIAGPLATDIDHALRILDFGRAAPAIEAGWPPATRAFMDAFVVGLNHATMQGPRPPELTLLGLEREPYTVADLLAIGRLAGTDISWLTYLAMLPERGGPNFTPLWRRVLEAGASLTPPEDVPRQQAAINAILQGTAKAGSNTVAVAPARSASGAAMIASDPHLGMSLPNLWLLAGMRSPSYHLVGLMIPGLPIVAVGRNPYVAWGGTNLRSASSDLFDVGALPDSAIETRDVRIRQRLWFSTTRQVRTTEHGPILTDAKLVTNPGGRPIALRWAGHEPTDEITALLAAARARDGAAFEASFARFGVSPQNFFWVDRAGGIGRFTATVLPDRAGFPPNDPVLDSADPAATGPWRRLRSAANLPRLQNPPEGFLASANENPATWADQPSPIGWFFSDGDRVARLRTLLQAKRLLTPDDLTALQTDTRADKAAVLAAGLLERLDGLPGGAGDGSRETALLGAASGTGGATATRGEGARATGASAVAAGRGPATAAPTGWTGAEAAMLARLRGWDGDYAAPSEGALVFELLIAQLAPLLLPEGRTGGARGPETGWNFLTTYLLRDLDALPPARRQAVLRQAVAAAAPLAAQYRVWGDIHRQRAAHWLVNLPVVGRRFVNDLYPVGGSRETPMKTGHGLVSGPHEVSFGSMARHVTDMADADANWFVLFGGQDGFLGSTTFADQVPLWREKRSIRLPMRAETVAREYRHTTRLVPR